MDLWGDAEATARDVYSTHCNFLADGSPLQFCRSITPSIMRLSYSLASLATLLAASAPASAQPSLVQWANSLTTKNATESVENIVSQWDLTNLTLAAVRRSPANWPMPMMNKNWTGVTLDINATVDLGVSLIQEAAAKGARVVTFPEVWFPGYPKVRFHCRFPTKSFF